MFRKVLEVSFVLITLMEIAYTLYEQYQYVQSPKDYLFVYLNSAKDLNSTINLTANITFLTEEFFNTKPY